MLIFVRTVSNLLQILQYSWKRHVRMHFSMMFSHRLMLLLLVAKQRLTWLVPLLLWQIWIISLYILMTGVMIQLLLLLQSTHRQLEEWMVLHSIWAMIWRTTLTGMVLLRLMMVLELRVSLVPNVRVMEIYLFQTSVFLVLLVK